MADFEMLTTGRYAGVGSLIRKKGDYILFAQPYKGSPSDEAGVKIGDKELLRGYLNDAEACFDGLDLNFSLDEWRDFIERYTEAGMPAVHHSDAYRESEKPSYRVVRREALEKFI
jgi:hypothetical protein